MAEPASNHDIFISYPREDADFAARLKAGIETGGLTVWMDTASLAGGRQYTQEIESAIESASSVVVVVSGASNRSEWVRRETLFALQRGKPIVPVLSEDVTLPVPLADRNALDVHDDFDAGLTQLRTALQSQVGRVSDTVSQTTRPIRTGTALWLCAGAAVVVALAVIALRGGGPTAEVLGTGLAVGAALLAMAWKADDAISVEFKRDLSLWLVHLDPKTVGRSAQHWPNQFAALFDRVFGKKHLSFRCFFRSSIASLLAFLLCTLIYIQSAPGNWSVFFQQFGARRGLVVLFITGAIMNLLPDYLSLLETRYVIQRMHHARSFTHQVGWLLVDLVATGLIFFALIGGVLAAGNFFISGSLDNPARVLARLLQLSVLIPVEDPKLRFFAVPVWTTFFTTVWVWFYFLAQFLVRLITPARWSLNLLQYVLPVDQRPLRAIGQVMALLACLGYCLVMIPGSAFGRLTQRADLEPEMVEMGTGSFSMGDLTESFGYGYELPVHRVNFSEPFAIGKYEVTFDEYDLFAKATRRPLLDDEGWGRGKRPVINVSWDEASAYTKWLSEQTGKDYRLPTEAEWEYVARGGTKTQYWWGGEIDQDLKVWANCDGCGSEWDGKNTAPVGQFPTNPYGVHDTAGNVREWVEDCWNENYEGAPGDGSAWLEASGGECGQRVIRGGSWDGLPRNVRSAIRDVDFPDNRNFNVGIRLAQDL